MNWTTDQELFELARRELYTAVVGDIMDTMGLQRQFLPPQVQPIDRQMVVVGRAMPVLEADCFDTPRQWERDSAFVQPFGLMLRALDDLKAGEVYFCTGASPTYALWGELMSTRAMKLGAAGTVLNGYARDLRGILRLGFPTFCFGSYAQDQAPRGRVVDFRCKLQIGQVSVSPGDIVFGDIDGVLTVPKDSEREVFTRALEKVRGENIVRTAIEQGMSATAAFAKYGIM